MPVLAGVIPALGLMLKTVILWLIGKAITRFLLGLGVGLYSYSWMSDFQERMQGYFQNGLHSLPLAMLQLLQISGVTEGFNIFFGGIAMIVSWYASKAAIAIAL